MKKLAFLLLILGLSTVSTRAQNGVCGTSIEDQMQQLDYRESTPNVASERGVVQYVPIHFHITANTAGTGRVRYARILDQMCQLNKDYDPVEFRFYLREHHVFGLFDETIANDNVHNNQQNFSLMNNKRHFNAMNVYIVNEAVSGNNQPGTTLAYYNTGQDWIVSRRDQINGSPNNGTLSHEIGHFFTLAHTFLGWESESFTSSSAGWPKAPVISPGGVATERQNGTNCTTAADRICDTPPDYNFGFVQGGCSNYTGGAQDPLGELVDPMENNFMSYFSNCSNYQFTPNQITQMRNNLNSTARNYLKNTFVPAAETITSPTDLLVLPEQASTSPFYDLVNFEWKEVPGATYYLFEIDRVAAFSTGAYQSFIIKGDTKHSVTSGLLKNTQYYWRVRPFNEYATCDPGRSGSFRTGQSSVSGVREIDAVNEWKIQPNPVASGANLQIVLSADRSFEAQVTLYNSLGQAVFQKNGQRFLTGENTLTIDQIQLAPGIYFANLTAGDASMTKRIVVE